MNIKDFFDTMKETFEATVEFIDKNDKKSAFQLCRQEIGKINAFITFLEENEIISVEDLNEVLTFLTQALENEDAFLLKDVMKYVFLDIIKQLEGVET